MIIEEVQENQVWIAGGIGITPFISYIREHPILDKQVHFYYSFRGEEMQSIWICSVTMLRKILILNSI